MFKSVIWCIRLWTNSIRLSSWSCHPLCYYFFLQAKYLGTPLLSKYFNFPKWEPRPIFKIGDLPKSKYLWNYMDIVLWSHYFLNVLFYKPLTNGFQTPLRKHGKGDVYVSISFYNCLKRLTTLFKKNSFQLLHGMIPVAHLFNHCLWWCLVRC
jgi:hypothetical protein